jgi:NADH-quinone oxidoreductase subunit N
LAGVFTAMLLSLAGIPLTAGFVGKFFVLGAGVGRGLWVLVIVMVAASAIGLYYYLRVVIEMFKAPDDQPAAGEEATDARGLTPAARRPGAAVPMALGGGVILAALVLVLVWLGVYPGPLIRLIEIVAEALG